MNGDFFAAFADLVDDDKDNKPRIVSKKNWNVGDFVCRVNEPDVWWFVQCDGSHPGNSSGHVYAINNDSQTNIYYPDEYRLWTGSEPAVTPWLQQIIDKYRLQFAEQQLIASRIDSDSPVSQDATD